MVLKVYLKILMIVLFYAIESDNTILADETFSKALQSFETYVLLNNNLWAKLFL